MIPLIDGPSAWRDLAACRGLDTSVFHPEHGESSEPAKRVCTLCPVAAECLQDAIDTMEPHGVRGGYTAKERLKFRTRRRKTCKTCGRIYSPHETGRQVYCSEGCAAIGRDRLPSRNGTAA